MPQRVAVILVVGLNRSLIGSWSPNLDRFARNGSLRTHRPDLPAVTCTVQSSMLTGVRPQSHGIVGNGWYDRESAEIRFWKQSNHLVRGEKVWETARRRDPSVTCAKMFWWYNMHSSADFSVTPRPMYKADGRKIPDCYAHPSSLRDELQAKFGQFPLFRFWGPASSIESSRWIADATMHVAEKHDPTITLTYLPHLDYNLQKLGPDAPAIQSDVAAIDAVVGELIDFHHRRGARVMIVSEYGIEPVDDAVHPNRILREAGAVAIREEQGGELLDPGASDAFAVADHQVAHIYVRDPGRVAELRALFESADGVARVLGRAEQDGLGIRHERSGDLVLVSEPRRWFSYYHWLDDDRAPDFARCVDIHRKPGYDPVELFIDPAIRSPKLAIASRLIRKKLGFRTLMDLIPLDASLVRGSHGRIDQDEQYAPVVITDDDGHHRPDRIHCTDVRDMILERVFPEG